MFSTLRTRFGIPGVISVIALAFALVGGAYAANSSSSGGKAAASAKAKKGPRGPKGATGPAGPAGAQGPAGPAGAKGEAGANGSNGSNGAAGATGATGARGATGVAGATGATGFSGFTETLPSGKTETGSWVAYEGGIKGNHVITAPISFSIPMAQPGTETPKSAYAFSLAETEEIEEHKIEPGGCKGSVEHPTAPSGVLCVYTGLEEAFGSFSPFYEVRSLALPRFGAYSTAGAALFLAETVEETTSFNASGSWAITAP